VVNPPPVSPQPAAGADPRHNSYFAFSGIRAIFIGNMMALFPVLRRMACFLGALGIVVMFGLLSAQAVEATFADYNDQGFFNNFSGDSGVFANGDATLTVSFDNRVFHGTNGASLRLD
jgi:hypothetical protein